jgi:hypothetical protein
MIVQRNEKNDRTEEQSQTEKRDHASTRFLCLTLFLCTLQVLFVRIWLYCFTTRTASAARVPEPDWSRRISTRPHPACTELFDASSVHWPPTAH